MIRFARTALWSVAFVVIAALTSPAIAQRQGAWVTSWAAAAQGPYPAAALVAQPDQSMTIPDPTRGARDQSFRMIVRPSVWGPEMRVRFTNVFGSKSLAIDGVFVGVQSAAASLVAGSNRPLTFDGKRNVTIPAGSDLWSDPVKLPPQIAQGGSLLAGRKLAISFHVAGESGPITFHGKAMQTSYLSGPGEGSHGSDERESAFPYSITSWLFLDAVDMRRQAPTPLVVCIGDSITDGTNSTLNGDDRWPDQLQRRFNAILPNGVAVVDEGIGSNRVTGPIPYDGFGGGPAALERMQRDVASLSGVKAVIWFEGVNDLSNGTTPGELIAGLKRGVAMLRAKIPGVRVVGAIMTPVVGGKGRAGTPEEDKERRQVNDFIRNGGLYDGVIDFEKAVIDPATGGLKPQFVFGTTLGGPGDKVHPNRGGYLAMADAIDLKMILPALTAK